MMFAWSGHGRPIAMILTIAALTTIALPPEASAQSDYDLYILRLVNRARVDPAGEAARIGSAVTDARAPVPPLAYHLLVGSAAFSHNGWMHGNFGSLASGFVPDSLTHYQTLNGQPAGTPATATPGYTGVTPGARVTYAGFTWGWVGENITVAWSTASLPVTTARIDANHKGWWESSGHHDNMLSGNFTVFGHQAESREFSPPRGGLAAPFDNIHFATQNFARPLYTPYTFVLGLIYLDRDSSAAWTPRPTGHALREGLSGVGFSVYHAGTSSLVTTGTTQESGAFSVNLGNGSYDLVFTGSAIPAGSYTIAGVTVSGASVDAGDHEVSAVPADPPVMVFARSRRTHGAMGDHAIELPLTGTAGIESRTGTTLTLLIGFDRGISAVDGTVDCSEVSSTAGACSAAPLSGADAMILTLGGVTANACVSVTLNGIQSLAGGELVANNTVSVRVLPGDATADGVVNIVDLNEVKGDLFQSVAAENFRSDVNADGVINIVDLNDTKANLFATAPCP